MPKRNKGETDSAFVGRCMKDKATKKEFPDSAQRLAVCISKSKESAMIESAHLPLNTSYGALRGHLRGALETAHGIGAFSFSDGPWILDIFAAFVVYDFQGISFKRSYSISFGSAGSEPNITLGEAKRVHVAYVDSKNTESQRLFYDGEDILESYPFGQDVIITVPGAEVVHESVAFGDFEVLKEAEITNIPVKIIGPGWGSMAFYSESMLKSSGPAAFVKGTHMYWNHPTATEEAERPPGIRDLNDLAAILTTDAKFDKNGPKGPGLYAEAKVFSDYAKQLEEKGPHIGVSINAGIRAHAGEAEGKSGLIADEFVHAFSADFVTHAGAKGAPVLESKRGTDPPKEESTTMTPEETRIVEESKKENETLTTENANLKKAIAKRAISDFATQAITEVSETLRKADIPYSPKLVARACAHPLLKEGKQGAELDADWIKSIVEDFTSETSGHIEGMGGEHIRESANGGPSKEEAEETDRVLKESLETLGVPEKGLAAAVAAR